MRRCGALSLSRTLPHAFNALVVERRAASRCADRIPSPLHGSYGTVSGHAEPGMPAVQVSNASFTWSEEAESPALKDADFTVRGGAAGRAVA